MQRTVIKVSQDRHKRFKTTANALGVKLQFAADQAIDLWIASHGVQKSQKSLQK